MSPRQYELESVAGYEPIVHLKVFNEKETTEDYIKHVVFAQLEEFFVKELYELYQYFEKQLREKLSSDDEIEKLKKIFNDLLFSPLMYNDYSRDLEKSVESLTSIKEAFNNSAEKYSLIEELQKLENLQNLLRAHRQNLIVMQDLKKEMDEWIKSNNKDESIDSNDSKISKSRAFVFSTPRWSSAVPVELFEELPLTDKPSSKPSGVSVFFKNYWKEILLISLIVTAAVGLAVAGVFTFGVVPAIATAIAVPLGVSTGVGTGIGIAAVAAGGAAVAGFATTIGYGIAALAMGVRNFFKRDKKPNAASGKATTNAVVEPKGVAGRRPSHAADTVGIQNRLEAEGRKRYVAGGQILRLGIPAKPMTLPVRVPVTKKAESEEQRSVEKKAEREEQRSVEVDQGSEHWEISEAEFNLWKQGSQKEQEEKQESKNNSAHYSQ